MIIVSPETEALARRLADAQSISVEDAVARALEASARAAGVLPEPRQPRDLSPEAVARRNAAMERIARKIAAMPVRDPRSPEEIMDDLNRL